MEKVFHFKEQFERVAKRGRRKEHSWTEEWFEQGNHKWARKEGSDFLHQWTEEWVETRNSLGQLEEAKCEKWGIDHQNNQEWT